MASNRPSLTLVHEAIACLGRLSDAFGRRRETLARSAKALWLRPLARRFWRSAAPSSSAPI
jgi:hypothetical protein